MPRLLGIRFESVGHRDARLDGLVLPFDANQAPADSVLWLRNGGGKSSILNLIFSVLRPNLREFLGSEADAKARRLEDYVAAEDTASVCLAWELDGDGDRRSVLFTAGVYHWSGSENSTLLRKWFALRVDPDRSATALSSLPLLDESGGVRRPLRHAALRERLLELHAPPIATLAWVSSQAEWEGVLESYGLDPQVFSYQLRMNRSEGAADQLFRHRSAEQLVDFLIEILLSAEEAEPVRETLRQYASQLARRPHLEREHDACEAAARALAPLAELATDLDAAHIEASERAGRLRLFLEAVLAAHRLSSAEAQEINESILRLADRSRQAGQQRNAAQVNAVVFHAEAAAHEGRHAADELRAAAANRDRLQEQRTVLRAAEPLAEVRRIEAIVGVKRAELASRLDENRPLLDELRAAAADLAVVLRGDRERIGTRTTLAHLAVSRAEGELGACRVKRDHALAEAARLDERARALEAALASSAEKTAMLEKRGDLAPGERPRVALSRLGSAVALHEGAEEAARQAATALEQAAKTAQQQIVTCRSEASAARGREASLQREHDAAERVRVALVNDEVLRTLVGDDAPDVVRLGAEIAARVRSTLGRLREQLLKLAVETREDARALDWLDRHRLLPPSIDAETVRDELRRVGIHAHTGNLYLAENRRGEAAEQCAEVHPALLGGVVVDAADEERAREHLRTAPPRVNAPLTVGTTVTLLEVSPTQPVAVLPPAGFWDQDAAKGERERREHERAKKDQRRAAVEGQHEAADAVLRKLESFVAIHTDAWYSTIRAAIAREAAAGTRGENDAKALDVRVQQLDAERALRASDATRHAALQKAAQAAFARVDAFVDEAEAVERVRAEFTETCRGRDEARGTVIACDDELPKLEHALKEREDQAQSLTRDGIAIEGELATLGVWLAAPTNSGDAPERGSLDELRTRFRQLEREYHARTAKEALQGEISALEAERERATLRLTAARGRCPVSDVERALEEAESGVGLVEAIRRADESAASAERRVGAADGEAKAAAQRAAEAQAIVQQHLDRSRSTAVAEARTKARGLDVAALRALVEREREVATRASAEETECETQRQELQTRADAADAAMLRLTAHRKLIEAEREHFGEIEAAASSFDRPPATIAAFELVEDLDEGVEAGVREVRSAAKRVRALLARVGDILRRLAAFAGEDAAASLPQLLRDRLREPDVAIALRRGPDLLRDVETRRGAVAQQLGQLDQHRRLIAQGLGRAADKAIDLLKKLERASIFPTHVKIWGDQPFLKVRLTVPEAAAERDAAIFTVIDRAAAAAQIPGALQLVQSCVRELTRATGIRMSMLKPEVHRRLDWVPIEDINKFSGGERITAAILLYATLAQLRAKQRGKIKAPTSVLLLDNPVGACSHPEFLELQREMARASGVQLVYTTGVDDLEALARLPNVVRLRNAHRDTRARRRVTIDGPAMEAVHVAWTKS